MKELVVLMQEQFDKMCLTHKLFRSKVSGGEVWNTYLKAFHPTDNPVFRDPNSSVNNCNTCNNFIRRYGNIVAINNEGKIESIFSNIPLLKSISEFHNSITACAKLIESNPIGGVFFETFNELNSLPYEKCNPNQTIFKLGIATNYKQYTEDEVQKYGVVNSDKVYEFNHFALTLPSVFVDKSGKSINAIEASYRDKYSVFKRAMEEIPIDTLVLVRDLINQGSLLDGATHLPILQKIIKYSQEYASYQNDIENWYWYITYSMPESIAKFKNHAIGKLCSDLAEGKELNEACQMWNKMVDPINYNKAKAPITEAQKKLAKQFVEENGYTESFNRRLATLDDIKASEILHINRDNNKVKNISIFDNIKTPSGTGRHKRSEFSSVEEVSIDKFMCDILPTCTSVELFLESRMEGNLVNLTTAAETSKQIFKWNNPFSYTFNGNLAGKSQIKENVSKAGGKVDGILRFSIQWNDEDTPGIVDFDAHAIEPCGTLIDFSSPYRKDRSNYRTPHSGQLDVDMINPREIGVENITWIDKSKMNDGNYLLRVHNYNGATNRGVKAEIEFEGNVFNYHLSGNIQGKVNIATINIKNGMFTIKHHQKETESSKDLWNLDTNQFHKVNLVCLSPNHWGDDNIGNKHYLFMLENCVNPNPVRGFHNEHLISDLLAHRKVLDVLGDFSLIKYDANQIAGVGFNATVRDEVILKLQGSHKRIVKLKI